MSLFGDSSRSAIGLRRLAFSLLAALGLPFAIGALPPSVIERPWGLPEVAPTLGLVGSFFAESRGGLGFSSFSPRADGLGSESGAPNFRDRALILCWHSFLGDPSLATDFSTAEFAHQLDELVSLGYGFPNLDDLLFGRIEGALNVIVTIDDGHRSVPAAVEKVLVPRGIRPALFVYPAVLGSTNFAMSDTVLRALRPSLSSVGAHGYHHLFVTEELRKKDPAAFEREIYKAKDKTESLYRASVLFYAYPFGALSLSTKIELERAGYSNAFAVGPGFVYSDSRLNDPYQLPRLVVSRDNWKDILALLARNVDATGF